MDTREMACNARVIANAITLSDYSLDGLAPDTIAIRWDARDYNPGQYMPVSHVWDDGRMTDELLAGTCVIPLDKINRIANCYPGSPYLVIGVYRGSGYDDHEQILNPCLVVCKLAASTNKIKE